MQTTFIHAVGSDNGIGVSTNHMLGDSTTPQSINISVLGPPRNAGEGEPDILVQLSGVTLGLAEELYKLLAVALKK